MNFSKLVSQDLMLEIDFLSLSSKRDQDLHALYLIAKEGFQKSALGDYNAQPQALSSFSIAAMILSDSALDVFRRELRRLSPGVKIETEQIKNVLIQEVLTRDVSEGEKAEDAKKKVAKAANKIWKARAAAASGGTSLSEDSPNCDATTTELHGAGREE